MSRAPIFPILTLIIILNGKSRGEVKSGGDIPGVTPSLCITPCKAYLVYVLPG